MTKNKAENTTDEILLNQIIEKILSFPASNPLSFEYVENLAKEIIDLNKIENEAWIINRLQVIKEKYLDENKDKSINIEISKPSKIENEADLNNVIKKHHEWIESVKNPRKLISGGRANLSGANLSGFSLKKADLSCANLEGAQMIGCNLSETNFSRAKLTGANLQGSIVFQTVFKNSKMNEADLRDAEINEADFTGVDLKNVMFDPYFRWEGKKSEP